MKNSTVLTPVIAALACAGSLQAGLSYSTSFESPFTAAALANQQGWAPTTAGASGNYAVGNAAGRARTGSQYAQYDYTSGTSTASRWSWIDQPQTAAQLASDWIVTTSVWVQILTPAAGTTRITGGGLDAYNFAGSGRLGAMRLQSDGKLVLINSAGSSGSLNVTGFAFNTYYQLSMSLNFQTNKISWSFNGSTINTSSIAGLDTFVGTDFGDTDLYITRANPSSGTAAGGHLVTFDDYSISSTPAPGAVALLGVAGLIASRRRR